MHFSTLKNNIQFTFSLAALKVMIGVVVLSVGVVHSATQWSVNAKAFETALYIVKKHLFCIMSQALAMLPRDNCNVNCDITPSVAVCTRVSPSSHTPHPTTTATTYFNI